MGRRNESRLERQQDRLNDSIDRPRRGLIRRFLTHPLTLTVLGVFAAGGLAKFARHTGFASVDNKFVKGIEDIGLYGPRLLGRGANRALSFLTGQTKSIVEKTRFAADPAMKAKYEAAIKGGMTPEMAQGMGAVTANRSFELDAAGKAKYDEVIRNGGTPEMGLKMGIDWSSSQAKVAQDAKAAQDAASLEAYENDAYGPRP